MRTRVELGWTAEEYERCPEMANRLHRHILNLEDEVDRLREAIHAHRTARRYNPRATWVDARLWDATGEDV